MNGPKLSPEDQARVDKVINGGVNAVERKPFRPFLLLSIIIGMMVAFSGLSYFIAWYAGAL